MAVFTGDTRAEVVKNVDGTHNPVVVVRSKARSLGYRQITDFAAAKGLGVIPDGAHYALIAVSGAQVRYRDDGTNPTSALGQLLQDGDTLNYDGALQDIKFMQVSAGAVLDVTFYS